MKIREMFPGRYISAEDVGEPVTRVISEVRQKDFGDAGTKPVVSFVGGTKKLILNVTNARRIAAIYGDDTDACLVLHPSRGAGSS